MRSYSMVLLFVILFVTSPAIKGNEESSYQLYYDHEGKLCHGLNVGDFYKFEETSGSEIIYENGTTYVQDEISVNISLTITEVSSGLISPSKYLDTFYRYNMNQSNDKFLKSKVAWLWSYNWDNYNFFTYVDWNAWINVYNNITQNNIENNWEAGRFHADYFYIYPEQTNSLFNINFFGGSDNFIIMSTHSYNKSDGSLISWNFEVQRSLEEGIKKSSHWGQTNLVSKQKVSDENVCPALIEDNSSDDNPGFNFVYLVLLIPIIKIKKFLKFERY